MGFLYGRLISLLIQFVVVALLVIRKAIQWINEYRKNQKDCEDSLERQLEILKYKHSKNMAAKSKDTPKDDTEDK